MENKNMTGATDRKGQILHWDDLFAKHADRAATTAVDAIDRDLLAMGFDPAKVQQRVSVMDSVAHEPMACIEAASVPLPDAQLPPAIQPSAWTRYADLLTGWHFGSAMAGAMGVMVAGLIGLVTLHGMIGGAPAPSLTALDEQTGALLAQHKYDDAEPLYRLALSLEEKASGSAHPKVAARLNSLAHVLQARNRLDEAEPLMLRALEIDWQHFASDPTAVARDLNNIAQLLVASYRQGSAEEPYRFALAILEQFNGPDHPDVATVLSNLANVLQATNRTDEAEALVLRALEIGEFNFGPDHDTVARNRANLRQLREASTSCGSKGRDAQVKSVAFRAEETAQQGETASPGQHLQLAKWQVKSTSTKCAV